MKYKNQILCGDCLKVLPTLPSDSIDLVFGSPPYPEGVRTYGIGFNLKGQEWIDWMIEVYIESLRVCKGLVAFVIDGRTKAYKWSCTPALLVADLHRAGINMRKPPIFHRVGIPGSGGPDWLRSDYEWIICASQLGRLAWSNNTAMGHPPKWKPGGELSYRLKDGKRIEVHTRKRTSGYKDGDTEHKMKGWIQPKKANPGNVIKCIVGGGKMGSKLAHENEAPFPEKLAEFMIRSFCPPHGVVLDPFSGSGTTAAVAKKLGRLYCGIDIRESQCRLTRRRLRNERV